MNPLHGVRKAWWLLVVAVVCAGPAGAQLYEDARRSLALDPDGLERSARLSAMGRLVYSLEDAHVRADLWEFARNDAGLLDSDSTSSFEVVPVTSSSSTLHDELGGTSRQDFALREVRFGYEGWRRSSGGAAFGVIGEAGRLRNDVPQSLALEQRTTFSAPHTELVIAGRSPLWSDRLTYGLHVEHRYQAKDDDFRTVISNGAGAFIDQEGVALEPPDVFTPDRLAVRSVGAGGGLAYKVTPGLTAAIRGDYVSNTIEGKNEGSRYASELKEDRPVATLGGAVAGTIARIRYVGLLESWSASSDQTWAATMSAGSGQVPAQGRGEYASRDESGNRARARASWTTGALTFGVGGGSYHQEVDVIAPPANSTTSFNYFMNYLSGRPGADSLSLPDSVRSNHLEHDAWDVGGGVSIQLPWRTSVVGAELHKRSETFTQDLAGDGPEPSAWDVRLGAEVTATPALRLRGGYSYQSSDNDETTAQNEFVTQGVTTGFGLRPVGAAWTIEMAYGVTWGKADFGDPTRQRSNRQQIQLRIRWGL